MNGKELVVSLKEAMDKFDITPYQLINGEEIEDDAVQYLNETFGEYEQVFEERDPYKNSRERHDEVVVLKLKDHNVFVMFEGEYSSWEGTEYEDGPFLCTPHKVYTTEYRKV